MRYTQLFYPVCLLFSLAAQGQSRPVTDFKQIKSMADSNRFQMTYTVATTHHTFYLQPTTAYSNQNIRIAQDSAFMLIRDSIASGRLPYFGSGYAIPQTGNRGIVFNNKMLHLARFSKGRGRKQSITYLFDILAPNDTYSIRIDIRYNGRCYLYINSLKRSPISYIGQIVETGGR